MRLKELGKRRRRGAEADGQEIGVGSRGAAEVVRQVRDKIRAEAAQQGLLLSAMQADSERGMDRGARGDRAIGMKRTYLVCPSCGEEVPLSSRAAFFRGHVLAVEGEGILNSHHKGRKFTIPKTKILCPEQFGGRAE